MSKKTILFTTFFLMLVVAFSSSAFANWYVGTLKGAYSYYGTAVQIKTPASFPTLSSGQQEFAFASTLMSNGDWIQTGIDGLYPSTVFKTYIERTVSGVHTFTEIGTQLFSSTIRYKVVYNPSTSLWDGYIADVLKGSYNIGTAGNAQANAETHSSTTALGPFQFIDVVYKPSSAPTDWAFMDVTPTAASPYHVTIVNNYNYTAY